MLKLQDRAEVVGGSQLMQGNKLAADDRAVIERLLWVLELLKKEKPGMTVHMASALLRVAISEGKSVNDLTREAGVAQSVMSRALLDLGPMTRDREPGLGLVEHRLSPTNMRTHEVSLTRKGVALLHQIASMLRRK